MNRRFLEACLWMPLAGLISLSCASQSATVSPADLAARDMTARARELMGTRCEIRLDEPPDSSRFDRAFQEIDRIETMLSTWREDSELSRLNRQPINEPFDASAELISLLRVAIQWSNKTEGGFSPLIGRLIELWDIRGAGAVPSKEAIDLALDEAKPRWLRFEGSTITRLKDIRFEEGGFGKGYASERAMDLLRFDGVKRGVIDFGGQLTVWGFEHEGFPVQVASPDDRNRPVLSFTFIANGSVSTSSASEKTFRIGDKAYSHLVDPRTGEALPPAGSVTVLAPSPLEADILSTALYVLGPVDGLVLATRLERPAMFLVPRSDGTYRVRANPAFAARIKDLRVIDPKVVRPIEQE